MQAIVHCLRKPVAKQRLKFPFQQEFAFANKDFLQNCLDYLVNSSNLSEAKAKDYTLRLLDKKKTEAQKSTWQLINIIVPVILVLLFAFVFQFIRKRKYTVS